MSIYDTSTESGRLLDDGYKRLCEVDYDPGCEMVNVLTDYGHLPALEKSLNSLERAKDKINEEYYSLKIEVEQGIKELYDKISKAEIKVLDDKYMPEITVNIEV